MGPVWESSMWLQLKSWDLSEKVVCYKWNHGTCLRYPGHSAHEAFLKFSGAVHSRFKVTVSKIYFAKITHDFNERWYYLTVLTQVLKDDSFVSANCNARGVWKPGRELFAAFSEPDCDELSFCFEVAHAQGEVLFNIIQQGALFLFLIVLFFCFFTTGQASHSRWLVWTTDQCWVLILTLDQDRGCQSKPWAPGACF